MRKRITQLVTAGVALAFAATALPVVSTAEAGHRGWSGGGYHHHHHFRHRDRGSSAAAGIFGFAAGALLGSALAQPRHYYAPPPPPVYYSAAPVTYVPAPWTPEWYSYCASKYVSFDRHSGTFMTYSGVRQLCR